MKFNLGLFKSIVTVASIGLLLTGCGGGGGGGVGTTASTLGGTAAVGFPIVSGIINVSCAAGSALTTTTSSTGSWQVTVSGQTLPCAVQVAGGTINSITNTTPYHSIATAFGTVNVTPLTDLMVANLAVTATPGTWFAGLNSATLTAITQTNVDAALSKLRTALGLTPLNTINPITTAFTPVPGNTSDDMLTALKAAMTSASVTYANLLSNASAATFVAPTGFGTALTTAYAGTTSGGTGGGSGSGNGTTSGAVTADFPTNLAGHFLLSYSSGPNIGIDLRTPGTQALRVTLNSAGGLSGYDTQPGCTGTFCENVLIGTNSVAELGGNANITWGRWNGGTTAGSYYNHTYTFSNTQGFHYVLGVKGVALPTTGTVTYALSGATQPTVGSGGVGTFTGSVKVDYATNKVGVDFTVTMPDRTYRIVSNGGLTTLTNSELTLDRTSSPTPPTITGSISMPQGGTACPNTSGCSAIFDGMVVSAAASGTYQVGGTYMIFTGSPGAGSVHGAAVFQ